MKRKDVLQMLRELPNPSVFAQLKDGPTAAMVIRQNRKIPFSLDRRENTVIVTRGRSIKRRMEFDLREIRRQP